MARRTLDVYLHSELIGQLIQDEHGQILFNYNESWLNHKEAVPLSHSLPLRTETFSRNECRGFFAGILPDEDKRNIIASNLGISARNDFAMLEQIGGECAGAVTFLPEGEVLPEKGEASYRKLADPELIRILEALPKRPLMAGDEGVRLSLAGAQDKLVVRVEGSNLSIPLGSAPSTHILKPAIERFEGLVFNEAFCMQLAAAVGMPAASVSTHEIEGISYLLIERYDRLWNKGAIIERLHQEDFCQALGISPEIKYQTEGGPSLSDCFQLLRTVSSNPVVDLQRLLDAVVFNFLIGNNDAHGKNFSLIYQDRECRLSPLYDVLSTAFYPVLSEKMAMKIGKEYKFESIYPKHFEKLAEDAGLGKALTRQRVPELAKSVLEKLDNVDRSHSVAEQVAELTSKRCELVLGRFD